MHRRTPTVFPILLLCGFFLISAARARSWDFAVTIGREINFFASNRTLVGQARIIEAKSLTSAAYDEITHTIFLSDSRSNISIFSYNVTEDKVKPNPLLKKQNNSHILAMVFDASSRTLFWTDALMQAILKMRVPVDGRAEEPVILHNLTYKSPRGIALDVCNRRIYWTNSNTSNPSIESSKLDGSDRVTLINENLYEPLGLVVDHATRKLYWSDDEEGVHYKIERSNLDGSNRELLVHKRHHQPVYLAVDRESIYWSDWNRMAVWIMSKNKSEDYLQRVNFTDHSEDPTGIITRDNISNMNCKNLPKLENIKSLVPAQPTLESYNNLTTSTEEIDLGTEKSSKHCLNNGVLDNSVNDNCKCKPGYAGAFCEISLCYNYCFQGDCTISRQNLPVCKCAPGFTGTRCEKNVCDGYCLHDGQCSVQNGKPSCACKYSRGNRCEIFLQELVETCSMICADIEMKSAEVDRNSCRCDRPNEATPHMITAVEDSQIDNFRYKALLPILTALVIVLLLTIAVLSYYVNKLRHRRVKKRFVVRKNGITPLTSRPQIPDNQCEITIENCCNMNICETPCFEPNLRTTVARSSTRKEEKNSLLDNMEGNSC